MGAFLLDVRSVLHVGTPSAERHAAPIWHAAPFWLVAHTWQLAGFDHNGPQLFQIDPSGSYFAWKASAIGKHMVRRQKCAVLSVRCKRCDLYLGKGSSAMPST